MKLPFDKYALQAQVAPALISTFPALVLGGRLITSDHFKLIDGLAILVITVLVFAIANFARDRGLLAESAIFPEGFPSLQWLRFRDRTLDDDRKRRVLQFLCSKINVAAPTADHERLDPRAADRVYDQALKWLRDSTREPRFKLLLNENAVYGFYRNLYGMKYIGLALSAVVVIATSAFSGFRYWRDPTYDLTTLFLVLGAAAVQAVYFLVAVTQNVVKRAAVTYAQELYGAAQVLMTDPAPPPAATNADDAPASE